MRRALLLGSILVAVSGCVTSGLLSREQIAEANNAKESVTLCGKLTSIWGNGLMVYSKASETGQRTTEVTVTETCSTKSGTGVVPRPPSP